MEEKKIRATVESVHRVQIRPRSDDEKNARRSCKLVVFDLKAIKYHVVCVHLAPCFSIFYFIFHSDRVLRRRRQRAIAAGSSRQSCADLARD